MSKNNLSTKAKSFIAGITAVAVTGTMAVTGLVYKKKTDTKDLSEIYPTQGYSDVNPMCNTRVKEDNFVMLDVGDHDEKKTSFENRKIEYCNDKGIPLGLIISTNSKTENEIYDDVEFVKGLIRDYEIDLPIYLSIDDIINNDELNIELKTKLTKDFLEKCSANGIYVGICGSDENLCRFKKYCQITDYDAMIFANDGEDIKYDGAYSYIKNSDGTITTVTKEDIADIINTNNLNKSESFVSDGAYLVVEDEEFVDIAMKYGMSVNELLSYNGLKKKDVVPGTVLRIPCSLERNIPYVEGSYKELDTPIRGTDLSYCQGKNTDWDAIGKSVDYVIIRSNIGVTEDECFQNNINNCSKIGIPVGIYCYNEFWGKNDPENFDANQKIQLDRCLELLQNKKITYPVFLDIEASDIQDLLSEEQARTMILLWKEKIKEAGYIPGIYCSKSVYHYLQSAFSDCNLNEELAVWIAGGKQYYAENDSSPKISLEDISVPEKRTVEYDSLKWDSDILQVTNRAIGTGAGNAAGCVDINYSFVDYSKPEYEFDCDFDIKNFDSERKKLELIKYLCFASVVLVVGGNYVYWKKRKNGNYKNKNYKNENNGETKEHVIKKVKGKTIR